MSTDYTFQTAHNADIERVNREFEEKAVKQRAEELGFGYIDIGRYPINPDVLRYIKAEEALKMSIIPFYQNGKVLKIAAVDMDVDGLDRVITRIKGLDIQVKYYLCSESGMKEAVQLYNLEVLQKRSIKAKEEYIEADNPNLGQHKSEIDTLQSTYKNMPVQLYLRDILLLAISLKASDVHIQPEKSEVQIRIRMDGVLHKIVSIDSDYAAQLLLRIKFEGDMKSNINHIPQDGHLRFPANNRDIEVRISTLPTPYGESVVMRLLDSERGIKPLQTLGFSEHSYHIVETLLESKNGLILITGPTGSGKTTTLYSMLSELNNADIKILTLEDPVEYHLPGIIQSEVDESFGYGFDTGLKAMLRHDPDIILVGEIRTLDTAKLAAEASLTGHLVLSSLHTNNALGAIVRLRNLGMHDYNIAPAVRGVLAQRLVRRLCKHCKESVKVVQNSLLERIMGRLIHLYPTLKLPDTMYESRGCEHCSGTGYSGMTALVEGFVVDNTLHEMILKGSSDVDMTNYLMEHTGFTTLLEDGFMRCIAGDTDIKEVVRVVGSV